MCPSNLNFADTLNAAILKKQSQLCVGLDPRLDRMPPHLLEKYRSQEPQGCGCGRKEAAACIEEFSGAVIEAIAPHAVAVKLQLACFEMFGPAGMRSFKKLCDRARTAGLIVIADAKRGDIGVSAEAYSTAYLGQPEGLDGPIKPLNIDALTVNPLFGSDGIEPFLADCQRFGKGIFILVKTSNPGSADLQDLSVTADGAILFYERVADLVAGWGEGLIGESGYSSVGAVVGATHPETLARLRQRLPQTLLLVPGVGAQGAGAAEAAQAFDSQGLGAIITASRSIIYAGRGEDYLNQVAQAAAHMKDDLWAAVR